MSHTQKWWSHAIANEVKIGLNWGWICNTSIGVQAKHQSISISTLAGHVNKVQTIAKALLIPRFAPPPWLANPVLNRMQDPAKKPQGLTNTSLPKKSLL